MIPMPPARRVLRAAIAAAATVLAASPTPAEPTPEQLRGLLSKVAPSIVTVKAVLKMEMSMGGESQDQESRVVIQGVVVNGSGLVMTSNASLSADRWKEMMGGFEGGEGFDVKLTPTDLKVVFESESTEYPAFIVAHDSALDLAFLQVEELGERKVAPVAFDGAPRPAVGDDVVIVSRVGRSFDYAPHVETGRIAGMVAKPREAWMVGGGLAGLGLPVFTPHGTPVGVYVTLSLGTGDDGAGQMASMTQMLSSGGWGGMPFRPFVVPASAVKGLVAQAEKQAVDVAAKRKAAAPVAPTTPDAPPETPAP